MNKFASGPSLWELGLRPLNLQLKNMSRKGSFELRTTYVYSKGNPKLSSQALLDKGEDFPENSIVILVQKVAF